MRFDSMQGPAIATATPKVSRRDLRVSSSPLCIAFNAAHILTRPTQMASALTRGRTQITRTHTQSGHVVHEAADTPQFVNLTVLRGNPINCDAPEIANGGDADIELRVTVGEHDEALYFKIASDNMIATRLVDNLHVLPYEKVVVSTSRSTARCIVHGYSTAVLDLRL